MNVEELIREMNSAIARIEEKVKGLPDLEQRVTQMQRQVDRSESKTEQTEDAIREMKSNQKWLWGIIVTIVLFILGTIFK